MTIYGAYISGVTYMLHLKFIEKYHYKYYVIIIYYNERYNIMKIMFNNLISAV